MGCEELVEYVRCVCVWAGAPWVESGGVVLCPCEVSLDSLCRSMYLCIVLGGYLRI